MSFWGIYSQVINPAKYSQYGVTVVSKLRDIHILSYLMRLNYEAIFLKAKDWCDVYVYGVTKRR